MVKRIRSLSMFAALAISLFVFGGAVYIRAHSQTQQFVPYVRISHVTQYDAEGHGTQLCTEVFRQHADGRAETVQAYTDGSVRVVRSDPQSGVFSLHPDGEHRLGNARKTPIQVDFRAHEGFQYAAKVVGIPVVVVRQEQKSGGYIEMWYAPDFNDDPLRQVIVNGEATIVIEPVQVIKGESD